MSKNINVNPGQYKVAGRERPGEDIPEPERAKGNRTEQHDTPRRAKPDHTPKDRGNQ